MYKDIQKHIKDKCANYAGNGQCLYDRPCPFFDEKNDRARCLYFENAVLPENEQLKADYWRRFGLTYWGEKDVKACALCGKGFTPQSNRQKYCSNCRDEQRRERAKLRKRKQRQNNRGYMSRF